MTRWSVGTDEIGSTPDEDDCFILDENSKSITDEVGNFKRPVAAQIVRDHNRAEAFEAMREACKAAIRYDQSIAGRARRGEVDLLKDGGGSAAGEDLDALYADWISKSQAAIVLVEHD